MELINSNFCKFNDPLVLEIESSALDKTFINGNNEIKMFFESLKIKTIDLVYSMSKKIYGIQRSKIALSEFYSNPYNDEYNTLRINNEITKEVHFRGELHIEGVWISKKSYGLYMNLDKVDLIKNDNEFKSDDEDELNDIIQELK